MKQLIASLRQVGFGELACQFARFIARLDKTDDGLIAITAALLSDANSQGHVCLNLAHAIDNEAYVSLALPEQLAEWVQRLKQSHVVGGAGDFTPLILTEQGLLYLYRYWVDEQNVANAIRQRCQSIPLINQQQIQQDFADWSSNIEGVDWQKVAVFMALTRQFSVISGGPGTGKTTIVLRLLSMLFSQNNQLNIALTAPTGKAAARLQQAINNSGFESLEAKTLHRLLGISVDNQQGRYNAEKPLPVDVVIIDEASMIDISLMATLMKSLPAKARVILLGDSQQLASVESGAVLANLCQKHMLFSTEFCNDLATMTGIKINASQHNTVLIDGVVELQHSYRFEQQSDIGRLATAVQSGNIQSVFEVISTTQRSLWQQQCDPSSILSSVTALYQPFFDAVNRGADTLTCLQLFEQQRVLCALKTGSQSVQSVNGLIERVIQKQGWRTNQNFYHGRPIMVTQNDHLQHLFNGDTGVVLRDESGELRACFIFDNVLHWFDLARLPAHETAFAMTVHKSQGSEFDNVFVLLAEEESPLLTRELLYTAITRAKKQVMLLCSETILTQTVITQHQRETGLAGLLEKKSDA
ncbi:MAG: exodeoxyribonuclease V subunit alpha [Piscirickettsiaceae bacterium]|nr:exodeoxyribonuclease V subunit alpha [Piscirickettsiaceae bacterium]